MKNRKILRPAISSLKCDAIHTRSVWANWNDMQGAGGEPAYTAFEAITCEDCGAAVVLTTGQGGESHRRIDGTDCDGYIGTNEGPMMSYSYELPNVVDPVVAARAIAHLPLCVIEWGEASGREGYALALTGGGMDLSWEICEAFMCLWYAPPLAFCGRLQDMGKSAKTMRYVLSGARRSIQVARNWLASDARTVADLSKKARAKAAREKETA